MVTASLGYVAYRETFQLPGRPEWRQVTEEEIRTTWSSLPQDMRDGWEQIAQAVIEAAK